MKEWITGRNPVYEVFQAKRRDIFRLFVAEGIQEKGRLMQITDLARQRKIPIEQVPRARIDHMGENPQGVALEVSGYPYCDLTDILDLAEKRQELPFILILDTLQNPQNLGTLLRTSEVVGVHGVILPFRHTADVTPAVVSASAGASEHMLITQGNLAQLIERLKEENIWIIGLEGSPEAQLPEDTRMDGPLALVVGNEGEGMRPLVRKSCDMLLRLPMVGKIESLNAAVAGSVALYLAFQARHQSN